MQALSASLSINRHRPDFANHGVLDVVGVAPTQGRPCRPRRLSSLTASFWWSPDSPPPPQRFSVLSVLIQGAMVALFSFVLGLIPALWIGQTAATLSRRSTNPADDPNRTPSPPILKPNHITQWDALEDQTVTWYVTTTLSFWSMPWGRVQRVYPQGRKRSRCDRIERDDSLRVRASGYNQVCVSRYARYRVYSSVWRSGLDTD